MGLHFLFLLKIRPQNTVKIIYEFYVELFLLNFSPMSQMKESLNPKSMSEANEVNGSPLNNSVSKNMWSFSKQKRFSICDKIYNLGSFVQPKKGAYIGYGHKSDFTHDLTCSPGSTRYNSSSVFKDNMEKKKGCSIGLGREEMPRQGHIELGPLKVPGPGAYEAEHSHGVLYSIRRRLKPMVKSESIEPQNSNPGPGAYENPQATSPRGTYYLTKFHDSKAKFMDHARRFPDIEKKTPGPGSYINSENDLSRKGKYILSKDKGYGTRSFEHQARSSFVDDFSKIHSNPGPGSYRAPSEFGYYDVRK